MQTGSPLEASTRPELSNDEADRVEKARDEANNDGANHDEAGNDEADSDETDSDEEENQAFSEVLASIRQENIVSFCIETRGRLDPSFSIESNPSQAQNATLEPVIFGSYHAIFPVKFHDEVRWILKVPAVGTKNHFDSSSAAALRSEASTMRLIRKATSIPLPDVFAFDASLDNDLGAPFILMSFAEGASAYDVWFDKTIAPEEMHARRTQILEDLATVMIQLDQFAFKTGGAPVFDQDGTIAEIGPMRCVDHQRMLERFGKDDEDETPLYYTAGPFDSPRAFYRQAIDREEPSTQPVYQGARKLLQLFLDWIPDLQAETPFVLAHPDFNFQNILVSPQGQLQSIIDWDGVAAVPLSIGNKSLPSFLTRDWDPAMYAWNEDMERGTQPDGLWEDSPETLQKYRREYQELFQARSSSPSGNNPSMTKLSLYVQNLVIAAEDTMCRFEILKKFVEEIMPSVLDMAEAGERATLEEDFNVFDISSGLANGTLEQRTTDLLRRGFETLLS
ncbi:unnamed protein product [Periconia digitata]|uniref:Aminoglycoside phosphotransferase domain-containing protein n=1 Tax=Periconia digitata TaxID=1303443 RepID=A0A9W4UPM7_9PLEO|nr:unnamed protein product [Periconia digitata]